MVFSFYMGFNFFIAFSILCYIYYIFYFFDFFDVVAFIVFRYILLFEFLVSVVLCGFFFIILDGNEYFKGYGVG